jgi:hypothetical protein
MRQPLASNIPGAGVDLSEPSTQRMEFRDLRDALWLGSRINCHGEPTFELPPEVKRKTIRRYLALYPDES